jgi:hypothetical protein
MDSELFEGIDETQKAQFIGNFFHFVKCRFQDCNTLAQTKSHSKQPTVAETVTREDAQDLKDWGSGKAIHTQAYHTPTEVQYTQTDSKQPTVAETVTRENAQDLKDWGSGKAIHTQAYHTPTEVQYTQTDAKKEKLTTNAYPEVQKEMAKEKAQELVTPTAKAGNEKDSEPKDAANVQIKDKTEKKAEKKTEEKTEKKTEKKADEKKPEDKKEVKK